MDNKVYLSVLTPAASSGSIGLSLTTIGASSDVTVVVSVTGIASGNSEVAIAQSIASQLNTAIVNTGALYSKAPVSLPGIPQASFQLTITDHVICVWSQAVFDTTVTSNTTGAIIAVRAKPALVTVANARTYGAVMGQLWTGLADSQIAILIGILSDEITSSIRNNIVMSTYLIDTWVEGLEGYRLPVYPVASTDTAYVLDPWTIYSITSIIYPLPVNLFTIQNDGWIMYLQSQDLVFDKWDPFAFGNQFRITWVAGWDHIPESVILALIRLSPYYLSNASSVFDSLKGGTSSVKYKDQDKQKISIINSLGSLKL